MESNHAKLSPYLIDATNLSDPHLVVREVSRPVNGLQRLISGTQPIDGGHLIFTSTERDEFLRIEPEAFTFFRPYIGSEELINGKKRYILALQNASPVELRQLPHVIDRLKKVRQSRLESKRPQTYDIANIPTEFFITVIPDRPFLAIPEVSSERREYAPIAYLEPPPYRAISCV